MRRHPWPVLCALCLPAVSQQLTPPEPAPGLPARETLDYAIEWKLVTAGRARLAWSGEPDGRGDMQLRLRSAGLVSKLFRVDNEYVSTLRAGLCVASSHMSASEGARRRDTRISYDSQARKASYLERDLVKNTVVLAREIDIPPCVYDVLGALYHVRTLNLDPGQSVQIPMSDGKKSVLARIEAQAREDVKTPAGVRKTIRFEAFLFNDVLYKRRARVFFWLSDDRQRLPVQIRVRMQIHIGTITLLLEKEEH